MSKDNGLCPVKETEEGLEARPVRLTRHGYKGSGVVVYTARCRTRKDLNAYVAGLPGMRAFEPGSVPYGYCTSALEPAMGDIIEEAHDGMVLVSHIIVVGSDGGEVTDDDELRHWDHEAGHLAYFFGTWGFPSLCATFGYEFTEADKSEAAAYMNEYIGACVGRDFFGGDVVRSGLPFMLPWMKIEPEKEEDNG